MASASFSSQSTPSVCLWKENPNRLVSLWDMLAFKAGDIYGRITALTGFAAVFMNTPNVAVSTLPQQITDEIVKALEPLTNESPGSPFTPVSVLAQRLITGIRTPDVNLQSRILAERVFALMARFKEICDEQLFFFIPKDQRGYFQTMDTFGPDFRKRFPSAATDAEESGKCLALDRPTACVFHLMRVAEHGLRRLARKLRVQLTHRGLRHPIEFADWEKVIIGCNNRIAAARTLPLGKKRQAQLDMYSDAADHCTYMKDIWRNNVSHARKPYSPTEAKGSMERVGGFMTFLARLSS
jgi:hypothetical protein